MTTLAPTLWRDRSYLATALTHFSVDVLNSSRTLLMALLALTLGLTNAQVGLALLLYNVGSALSQPLFGWVADRYGPRWLVLGGMTWMTFFYTLTAVGTPWLAVLAVTIAGLGSGAFHPSGALIASDERRTQRTQATAIFFMAGQLGLFAGPILAGQVLDSAGRPGFLILPLLTLGAIYSGWRWIGPPHQPLPAAPRVARPTTEGVPAGRRAILSLGWVILLINTASIATINFAPKLFAEQGYSATYVGWMGGIWMLGSAIGGVVGGRLADRFGPAWAIRLGLLGAAAPLYFYIPAPDLWRLPILALAGFFGGMPHSVLVIQAQALLPGRQALASGLTLGFMFASGALGSYALGIIADQVGLALALQALAILPWLALPAVRRWAQV